MAQEKNPIIKSILKGSEIADYADFDKKDLINSIKQLNDENSDLKKKYSDNLNYLREKINQLLVIMGTKPLKKEELDESSMVTMDTLGIIALSFKQVLEHLNETNLELNKSEEFLNTLIHTAPSGLFTVDTKGNYTSWNQSAEEITGFKADEVIGKPCIFLGNGDCSECSLMDPDVKKPVFGAECTINDSKGNLKILSKSFDILTDEKGEIVGGIESFIDITEKKKAEEYNSYLANITNYSGDAIISMDLDRNITSWNRGATEILGFTEEEMTGKPHYSIIPTEDHDKCSEHFKTAILEGHIRNVESQRLTKRGELIPVEITTSLLRDSKGTHIGYVSILRDITEKKKAQDILEEYSTRLEEDVKERTKELDYERKLNKKILDGIKEEIMLLSSDFKIIKTNKELLDVYNINQSDLIGKTCFEITHNRNKRCYGKNEECPLVEVEKTGFPSTKIHIHNMGDTKKYFEITVYPIPGNRRNKVEYVHISKDITTIMELEEELAYKNEELNSQNQELTAMNQEIVASNETLSSTNIELERTRAKLESYSSSLEEEVEKRTIELKKITEFNKSIILGSPVGIFTLDKKGDVTSANPECIRILGSPGENKTKSFNIFKISNISKIGWDHSFHRALNEGIEFDVEGKYASFWGKSTWVNLKGMPLWEEGEIVGLIGIIVDIADRKLAEEKLEDAYEKLNMAYDELKSLDNLKSNILANVSHELKTPITIARGAAELIVGSDVDEQIEFCGMIVHALEKQSMIIDNLVNIATIESGNFILRKVDFDMGELIRSVADERKPTSDSRGLNLKVDIEDDLPYINGDYNKIKLVLFNLIDNAIKFNKDRGDVIINAQSSKDSKYLEIRVQDTGIGISKLDVSKLFQPLTQLDPSTTRKYSGIGMGLTVAKEIITLHGGTIKADSEEGKGTTILCWLPIEEKNRRN